MKIKQKNTGKLVNNSLKPIATTTYSIPGLRLTFRAVPGPQPLSPNSAKNNLHKKTPKSLERKTPNRGKVAQPRVTSDSWKPPINENRGGPTDLYLPPPVDTSVEVER